MGRESGRSGAGSRGERVGDRGLRIVGGGWLRVPVGNAPGAIDLTNATGVPYGHGHRYCEQEVDGWAAVIAPEVWTQA